jgi:hypothetical protein
MPLPIPPTAFARRSVSYVGATANSRFEASEKPTPNRFMRLAPMRSARVAVASIVMTALTNSAVGRNPACTSLIKRSALSSGMSAA